MANKNLTDLTARTATADSDLIHVNSGGTDYKETKANFLSNITSSISSINSSLANSLLVGTPVTVQVSLSASGMQSVDVSDLGSPPSISGYVHQFWILVSSTYRFTPVGYGGTRVYYWVGTTSTSNVGMVCYPIYKKN